MDDHFNEPETYLVDETPGLSSVFLALQNVEIRFGKEQKSCAKLFTEVVPIGMSLCLIRPKMDDHFYEPETYFAGETPGLSSVFLALQNVKIRIGIEQKSCAKLFP